MKLTHNSLATTIAWVSTCLLAGGASTLFSESARMTWMSWGCFGLAAAVGLDVKARVYEQMRMEKLNLVANRRFERDMESETVDHEANIAIRQAVVRILGRRPAALQIAASRRSRERFLCDLTVELHLRQDAIGAAGKDGSCKRLARVTNLSESGFELMLTEPLPHRRMKMIITAANGVPQTMFGEILWYGPQGDGSIVAGGRFLDAASVEGA